MRQRPFETCFHSTWSIQNTANLYRVNILYVQWIWELQSELPSWGRRRVTALIAYFRTKLFLFPGKYQNSSIRKLQSSRSSTHYKSKQSFHSILKRCEPHINHFMRAGVYVWVFEKAGNNITIFSAVCCVLLCYCSTTYWDWHVS